MSRFIVLFLAATLAVASAQPGSLPPPQKTGGTPLMDALAKRATSRAFDTKDLPAQELSNLLWASFGVNRTDGRRTAPSARNYQETDLYVLTRDGAFLYDAPAHRLTLVVTEDLRALSGRQPFVKDAPVTLLLIADLARMGSGKPEEQKLTAYADAGFIAQNAGLYCAAAGLASGVRMTIERATLTPKLRLRDSQVIVLALSVGYPKP